MGKTTRKTARQERASNYMHKPLNSVRKTKSTSVTEPRKPSETRRRTTRALLHERQCLLAGQGKSKTRSQEGIIQQSKGTQKGINDASVSVSKDCHTTEITLRKRKERIHVRPPKKGTSSRSGISQENPRPSSQCVWEVNHSSSDKELNGTVKTAVKCQQKEAALDTSFRSGQVLVSDSPSITVVDLGPDFKPGAQRTISLSPPENPAGKKSRTTRRKTRLGSYQCDKDSHLWTTSDSTDSSLENLNNKERPMQSVFVIDLGHKPTRFTDSCDHSKNFATKGDSSKAQPKKRKLFGKASASGSDQYSKDSGGTLRQPAEQFLREEKADQEDLECGTSKEKKVKTKRKKTKSAEKKSVKKSKETDQDEVTSPRIIENDMEVALSPVVETSKQKTKRKKRKLSEVRTADEAEGRLDQEAEQEKRKVSEVGPTDESDQRSGREEAQMEPLNDNPSSAEDRDKQGEAICSDAKLVQTTNDETCRLHPNSFSNSLETSASVPAPNTAVQNVKELGEVSGSSPGSVIDDSGEEDEASRMDITVATDIQDGSTPSTPAQAESKSSYRILKLQNSDQCLVLLPHPSKFSFHGRVLLRSIHGSVTVLGFPVSTSAGGQFYAVYSPNSSCTLCMETSSSEALEDVGSSEAGRRTLAESVGEFLRLEGETAMGGHLKGLEQGFAVALIFKRMPADSAVEYVERCPGFGHLFSSPEPREYSEQDEATTSDLAAAATIGFQPTTPSTPGTLFTALPGYHSATQTIGHWLRATDAMPVVLVCGWKNTGKSTLCRYLSNWLLSSVDSVCYLECDMAQTEFTAPGMLSLHCITQPLLGPPFTHSRKVEKMCFYGDVNVRGDPESYLQMIKYLFQHYQTRHSDKPLIINTMGWMQGLGLKLLIDVVHITQPTHIIQLWSRIQPRLIQRLTPEFLEQTEGWWHQPDGESDGPDEDGARALCPEVVEVDVPRVGDQGGTKYKASDHRMMALLASLSSLQPSPLPSVPVALSSLTPLVLPWRCVSVHVTNGHVPLRQIMYALNGSIVGLCRAEPSQMQCVSEDLPRVFDSTPVCQCLGLGIIRGIDPVQRVFYILTGMSQDALQEVNALLKGTLTLPQPLLTQGHRVSDVPYMSREFSSVIIGSSAIKVRRNIKQRGR